MSLFLYRLGQRCARRPYRVLLVWLLLAAGIFAWRATSGGETTDDFRIPGVESQVATDTLTERFPEFSGASGRVVFHVSEGHIDDPTNQAEIEQAIDRLGEGQDVTFVSDPFDPASSTVSADGKTAFTTVQYDRQTLQAEHYEEAADAVEPTREAGVQAEISGEIAEAAKEVHSNEAIGIAIAIIVLLVAFGSVIAMGMPIGTAIVGVFIGLAGVGILAGFRSVPTISTMIATMIGLGVGIDYALFVVTRHREHLHDGMSVEDSAGRANATAGMSVLFAGTTVVIAICGLFLAGVPAIASMGMAVALVVIVSMLIAVTLLPAFLGMAGTKIDKLAIHRKKASDDAHQTFSGRWAHHVGQRPWRYALISLGALVAMAVPVLSLQVGMADDGNAADSHTERKAYDLTTEAYGAGFNGPLNVVVELDAPDTATLDQVSQALATTPGIAAVSPAIVSPDGETALIIAYPTTSPQDEATSQLLDDIRSDVLPVAVEGTGAKASVTGATAFESDLSDRLSERLPIFMAAVLGLSFVLLMVVFRSVLVPLKAAVMNLLSIGAAYGVVVAVFQWGWAKGLIGLHDTIPINPFVPLMMFAILFGLSMDYEVFLLSKVREEYLATGDSHRSVVDGLGSTARVITSAALIMISVFGAFVTGDDVTVKMFGLGLATAVLLDATIVRMVLVPATMALLGGANWWLPGWLDRILPHLDLEGGPALEDEPARDGELALEDDGELEVQAA
jgi:putative drug exporter of the RND superfamily